MSTTKTIQQIHRDNAYTDVSSLSAAQFGAWGEEYATLWLETQGWDIVDRNYHTRFGEIDIIAFDPDHTLCVVEVKARRSLTYGSAQEAVTEHKQMSLRKTLLEWIRNRNFLSYHHIRFDVITLVHHGNTVEISLIKEAF